MNGFRSLSVLTDEQKYSKFVLSTHFKSHVDLFTSFPRVFVFDRLSSSLFADKSDKRTGKKLQVTLLFTLFTLTALI